MKDIQIVVSQSFSLLQSWNSTPIKLPLPWPWHHLLLYSLCPWGTGRELIWVKSCSISVCVWPFISPNIMPSRLSHCISNSGLSRFAPAPKVSASIHRACCWSCCRLAVALQASISWTLSSVSDIVSSVSLFTFPGLVSQLQFASTSKYFLSSMDKFPPGVWHHDWVKKYCRPIMNHFAR